MLVVDSLRCCLTWTVEAITQSRNLRDKAARGREGEAAKPQGQRLVVDVARVQLYRTRAASSHAH